MLFILDADGTLVQGVQGIDVPNRLSEQELIPGVADRCAALRREGHTLAIASNQAGVALEYSTLDEAVERIQWIAGQIGAERWIISTWHRSGKRQFQHDPESGVSYRQFFRKPQPGMLLWLMLRLEFGAPTTRYIGDRPEDRAAALAAGIGFAWANDFLSA